MKEKKEMIWLTKKEIEEMRDNYTSLIDEYVNYIDNYRQYKEAQKRNAYYNSIIVYCDDILIEYSMIIEALRQEEYFKDIEALEYSKGYWRIKIYNKYKYMKSQYIKYKRA